MTDALILNAGSSSIKWTVLDTQTEDVKAQGAESWHGQEAGRHAAEMRAIVAGLPPCAAVGHRVVHGGPRFHEAVVIDDAVRQAISDLAELAPLHNPAALAGIEAATAAFPGTPQVAAFDTAFHATIPDAAAIYALPWEWTQRYRLRRYGFHGLSVSYATRRAREMLGQAPTRLLVCHLGAGCSVTAVANGHSADTSMGFTPLEGTAMATRSGSVDPGLLLFLLKHGGVSPDDLDEALTERSGLLGVSGVSGDLRAVLASADAGAQRAALAYSVFTHTLIRAAGAMIAVLGGLDAVVFTGGIGEHSARVRRDMAAALAYTGLRLDATLNDAASGDAILTRPNAAVTALTITAREDLAVLAEVRRLVLPATAG